MQPQPLRKQQRRKSSLVQQPEAARVEFLAAAARLVPSHAPQLAAHLVKEAAQVGELTHGGARSVHLILLYIKVDPTLHPTPR